MRACFPRQVWPLHIVHISLISVSCAFMSTLHIPHSPHPPYTPLPAELGGQGTHLFYRSHYARYHIPFFHNNGPWSSGVDSRLSSRCQHISVIYIDKVNGMECVCALAADSTRLDFNSSTDFDSNLPSLLVSCAEICISGNDVTRHARKLYTKSCT